MAKIQLASKGSKEEVYTKVLRHLSIVFGWDLSQKDSEILSAIYTKLVGYIKSGIVYDEANIILFNKDTKDGLAKQFNTSYNVIANVYTKFRKAGIVKDNKFNKKLIFNIEDEVLEFGVNYGIKEAK